MGKFIENIAIMKLFHFCILILLVLFIETEARRGGKGKGRGKGKGKGKGKWRKNKGKGKGMIFSLIKDDLMSCKVDECWPTCFTQGCIDCKSACYNENQNTKNTSESIVPQKSTAKKARKAFKNCNKTCKKTGVCPKWKNVPKVCKKCMKGCYKKTLKHASKKNVLKKKKNKKQESNFAFGIIFLNK